MLQRQSDALTAALVKIAAWLRRTPQTDQEAVGRRIGRALGKFPAAAAIIQATVQRDATGCAVDLQIASTVDAGQKAHRQKGAYLLRTNCEETDPAQLWRWYIQLTQAEAAFRTAKSDLGLRPVFHHKEDRVQAHLLVCFLALAMWRSARTSGCAPRAWAPARGNWSNKSPASKASTCSCRSCAAVCAPSCACASSPRPNPPPPNCSRTSACACRKARASSRM
jgi:hypothetical protein